MTLDEEICELNRRFNELAAKSPKTEIEIEEKEKVRVALEQALRREIKPLIDEMVNVGIDADLWDLVNTQVSYPQVIPILTKHLSKPYHQRNKAGIIRALAVQEAKGIANKPIMTEYRNSPKDNDAFRWTFGNTMTVIATENDLDDLTEIVLDKSNGDSRRSFIVALAKLKSPRVFEVLEHLGNDESSLVSEAARKALKKKQRHLKTK